MLMFCVVFIVVGVLCQSGVAWDLKTGTIAIFGGSGLLGRECVYQALKSNHKVVVLAKDPSKLLIPVGSGGALGNTEFIDSRLTVIKGDVTVQDDVNAVFSSHGDISGVIVALGGRTKNVGATMLTDGTKCIVNAMKQQGDIKRIAVTTSIGVGDSETQAPWSFRLLMYSVMRSIFKDKNNQEGLFLKSDGPGHDLEYVIVRPGQLGVGPPTGVVNVIDGKAGMILRSDVASFLLGAVTEEHFAYVRKTPCISSVGGTGWTKEKKEGFDVPVDEL